jgi:hypothetical protein
MVRGMRRLRRFGGVGRFRMPEAQDGWFSCSGNRLIFREATLDNAVALICLAHRSRMPT